MKRMSSGRVAWLNTELLRATSVERILEICEQLGMDYSMEEATELANTNLQRVASELAMTKNS